MRECFLAHGVRSFSWTSHALGSTRAVLGLTWPEMSLVILCKSCLWAKSLQHLWPSPLPGYQLNFHCAVRDWRLLFSPDHKSLPLRCPHWFRTNDSVLGWSEEGFFVQKFPLFNKGRNQMVVALHSAVNAQLFWPQLPKQQQQSGGKKGSGSVCCSQRAC